MTFLLFIALLSAKLHSIGFNPTELDDHLMMDAREEHLSLEEAVDYYTTNI